HSEYARRKKKRKRKNRSGAGGGKQMKAHLALTADDYILKQGRFREDGGHPAHHPAAAAAPHHAAPLGLKPEDLALIQQLGNSLKDIGQQAAALPPALPGDPIAPD